MTEPDPSFELLLEYLKETRGFDFTGYKRSSLMRRVDRRMSMVGTASYSEYLDILQVHPDEFGALFNVILINVTGFFRDPETWDYLRDEILPGLLAAKHPDAVVRVWSAGCASGEEAYTLAMLFAEALGAEKFRRRVKVYATDVDTEGLAHARHASYSEKDLEGVRPELRERYFDQVDDRYVFSKDLRRSVIFGRNDLVQDAPISRVDLLVCRNTLMYFNAEAQARMLARFHFALSGSGVLFLGKAETLLSHSGLFTPIDLKSRVFRKAPRPALGADRFFSEAPPMAPREELVGLDRLRDEAFLASPTAQVVVTADGLVALTNRQAEALFGLSSRDIGRPFRDLDLSYRPVELRRHIEQAQVDRRSSTINDVEYNRIPSETSYLEIQIKPLVDSASSLLGVTLVFQDVTSARQLHHDLEHANRQLEIAYEELQSTNEELETTNEELQSTVEELETTNEELQSTNEELETTNEELQSTNDELQHIDNEVRLRGAALVQTQALLDAVLASLRAGVTVISRDLLVKAWNRQAEELWGLRSEEVIGERFLNLDIGLPTEKIWPMIRSALNGEGAQELELAAVNRRGRTIGIRVLCTPLNGGDSQPPAGAILIVEQDGRLTTQPAVGVS